MPIFYPLSRHVGETFGFAGLTPPENSLMCDGSDISRVDYAELFDVIGTTYGQGDGATTFALPWLDQPQTAIVARV